MTTVMQKTHALGTVLRCYCRHGRVTQPRQRLKGASTLLKRYKAAQFYVDFVLCEEWHGAVKIYIIQNEVILT